MGRSDFQPGRTLLDWPDDVADLADALGIDRFAVLGYSGGAPYAAACAYRLPHRLTACGIVGGGGPAENPSLPPWLSCHLVPLYQVMLWQWIGRHQHNPARAKALLAQYIEGLGTRVRGLWYTDLQTPIHSQAPRCQR